MSINPKSVEFHQCHAKPHLICFFITILKITKEIFAIENTVSDLKVHALHYANELLVRIRLPFQNFCKIPQHTETNAWEKSNDAYSLSIRVQTTINHISIFMFFYHNINVKENVLFQSASARAEKGIARDIDASGVVGT